jgi:transposase
MPLPFDKNIKGYSVYLRVGATDFRRGIKGLISLVEGALNIRMNEKTLFVFCARSKKSIKILYVEDAGIYLIQRKVRYGCYPWPEKYSDAAEVDMEILESILSDPISIDAIKAKHNVERIQYQI